MIDTSTVPGTLSRALPGGAGLIGVTPQLEGAGLLWVGDDTGWNQAWTFRRLGDAVHAFLIWEPGTVAVCALCEREQGKSDAPGPWIRHQPSNRRRLPIFDQAGRGPLGWLYYVRP